MPKHEPHTEKRSSARLKPKPQAKELVYTIELRLALAHAGGIGECLDALREHGDAVIHNVEVE
jgi:hypothetical protein